MNEKKWSAAARGVGEGRRQQIAEFPRMERNAKRRQKTTEVPVSKESLGFGQKVKRKRCQIGLDRDGSGGAKRIEWS